MARTGLEFVTNDYDRDRFNRMMTVGEEMAGMTIDAEFTPERPYLADVGVASPKVGCSVAAFDDVGRVVLIKRADNGRWALPGGYAEVGSPPSVNALRELHEETGFHAELERLVGVYDNKSLGGVVAVPVLHLLLPRADHGRRRDAVERDTGGRARRSGRAAGEHVALAAHDARRLAASRRPCGVPVTKIAVWGSFGGMAADLPKQLPAEDVVVPKDESELSKAADAECAIGTNNGARVRKLLDAAPKLRWYHSVGAGVEDLVGVREFRDRGITLTNNSGPYDIQIAEHAIAFILAGAKRLHLYRDQQARKDWKDHRQDELRGSTLVVYGIGSIGAEIARLGAALGMRVIGVRRRVEPVPGIERSSRPSSWPRWRRTPITSPSRRRSRRRPEARSRATSSAG